MGVIIIWVCYARSVPACNTRNNIMVTTYHITDEKDTPDRETPTGTLNTRGLIKIKPIVAPN